MCKVYFWGGDILFSNLNTRFKTIVKVMRGLNKIPLLIMKAGFFISLGLAIASIIVMVYANENFFVNPSLLNNAECGVESALSILSQTIIGALLIQYFFYKDNSFD